MEVEGEWVEVLDNVKLYAYSYFHAAESEKY